MKLEKYSLGMGDRFLHQGKAQLRAVIEAREAGVQITPVWNKSDREHRIVGTEPDSLRQEADAAVEALGWTDPYRVDADHINLSTVDRFVSCSDFFTLDVGDAIGERADDSDIAALPASVGNTFAISSIPNKPDDPVFVFFGMTATPHARVKPPRGLSSILHHFTGFEQGVLPRGIVCTGRRTCRGRKTPSYGHRRIARAGP